jgi:peptide chain release factor 2
MAKPNFWNLGQAAQDMVQELRMLNSSIKPVQSVGKRLEDITVLFDLAEEENDDSVMKEVQQGIQEVDRELGRLRFRAMLAGANDFRNAYLSIHAGAGGTESCDWAQMLFRMYSRWAEDHGYAVEILDWQDGEQAGVRSLTLNVRGDWVYGYLQSEIGVHRLVRISPFDANKRRHTSFASVDVIPEFDDAITIDIKEKDLRIDTYRSAGAGGQHVNKTDSAVRITHIPTGIVVQCQNERSQHANRRSAMKFLQARLYRLEEQKREAELAQLYSEKGEIAWGNQIRSYVLQPYQMVKDHRTDVETSRVDAVLDGDIDEFVVAYLREKMSKKKAS